MSATRASVESTGWQAVKMSRRRSSSNGSSIPASRSGLSTSRADLELATELPRLSLVDLRSPQSVDRPVLGRGHEPGAGVVRDARLWPLLKGGDERLLGKILGDADVAHDPARPAISRADSIRQTASIVRLTSFGS